MIRSFNRNTVASFGNDSFSVQFNHAVDFCKDWLSGKDQFAFHTSGSTGTPKKILLNRTQLEASAKATINALQLAPDENIFVCLNTQLIAGTMMLVRGMMLGCEIHIDEPTSDPLRNISENHEYSFASFVPMQIHSVFSDNPENLSKLNRFRNILIGGASINSLLEKKLSALTTNIFHTYGMTETVSHIALQRIGKEDSFTILPGVEIKTDNRNCLEIKAGSTDNKWIVTNDIVELENEKKFRVMGRADEIINSGGLKILPQKIEKALLETLSGLNIHIDDLFISSEKDEILGERIIAVLCCPTISKTDKIRIFEKMTTIVSKYEVPKEIYSLPFFEKTSSGKTDKLRTIELLKK